MGASLGTRTNGNGFDMNRDLLVQSQPEMRANIALQLRVLAPVMLAMHGYVNPTLIDGLTKPHNPGLEYDLFLNWNPFSPRRERGGARGESSRGSPGRSTTTAPNGGQAGRHRRRPAPRRPARRSRSPPMTAATVWLGRAGGRDRRRRRLGLQRRRSTITVGPDAHARSPTRRPTGLAPVRVRASCFTGNPEIAEGWDDWGPFYTQTYGAFFGVDGSTLEMCSNHVCGGRFGSKRAQYIGLLLVGRTSGSPNRRAILRRPARDLPPRRDRGAEAELLRRRAGRGAEASPRPSTTG